jgi:hypothetical protein
MATAQPAGGVQPASDIRFRSARTKVLWISLVLGSFVLLAVPIHSASIADPGALVDERYGHLRTGALWFGTFFIPLCPSALSSGTGVLQLPGLSGVVKGA